MIRGLAVAARPRDAGRMDAVRCLQCGATRWSIRPGTLQRLLAERCEDCGGPVVRERRRPGAQHGALPVERREHDAPLLSTPGR
jgi:hypothetical protein